MNAVSSPIKTLAESLRESKTRNCGAPAGGYALDSLQRVFQQVNGDKALAGKMLGISRATLYRKLKRYRIPLSAAAGAGHADPQEPVQ